MYDPISGRGKIPAPDYSGMDWYQTWRQECREADKLIEREHDAEIRMANTGRRGRKRMFTPEQIKARRRARAMVRYYANHDEMLRRGAENRRKQKALRTAATVTQDRDHRTK